MLAPCTGSSHGRNTHLAYISCPWGSACIRLKQRNNLKSENNLQKKAFPIWEYKGTEQDDKKICLTTWACTETQTSTKETQPESWAFKCPNFPFLDLNIRMMRSNKGEMKETKTIRICRIIPVAKLPDWRQWNIAEIYSAYQVLILLHLEHSSLGLGNCHFLWDDPGQYFHLKSTRNTLKISKSFHTKSGNHLIAEIRNSKETV